VEPAEVAQVLTKCSAYDLRTVGRADVAAWHEILAVADLVDALDAVTRHYRESSTRAMPADILRHSKAAKRDRLRTDGVKSEALALPGRCESDPEREARIAKRIGEARANIRRSAPAIAATAQGPSAMDQLRAMTTGPAWPDPHEAA
jgi:hypothetical protein